MSRIQSSMGRTLRNVALTILGATIGNTTTSAQWQETVSDEGNYSIFMPGPGKCSTVDQPTPFGKSREHYCEYKLTSPDKEFVTSIRVCSALEPAKFLSKYTAKERIELIRKMFDAFYKSKLPDFKHSLQTKPGQILGRPVERVHSTYRREEEWSDMQSAMVYIDDVRYHIQVDQHGKGAGALLSDQEIDRIFTSFKLLPENSSTLAQSDQANADLYKLSVPEYGFTAVFPGTLKTDEPLENAGNRFMTWKLKKLVGLCFGEFSISVLPRTIHPDTVDQVLDAAGEFAKRRLDGIVDADVQVSERHRLEHCGYPARHRVYLANGDDVSASQHELSVVTSDALYIVRVVQILPTDMSGQLIKESSDRINKQQASFLESFRLLPHRQ